MLYIPKTQPPQILVDFIETEKTRINENYEETERRNKYALFGNLIASQKNALRLRLYNEQRGLCCYCMKAFEKENLGETKIEHFLPESSFHETQADYFNLYLVCSDNQPEQTCDSHKGNHLIPKFIGFFNQKTSQKCEDFFQYNQNGEILPKGSFKRFNKFHEKYERLNLPEKSALITIDILNLNVNTLIKERKEFIDSLGNLLNTATKESLEKAKNFYESRFEKKFAGVALYFIKEKLNRLGHN